MMKHLFTVRLVFTCTLATGIVFSSVTPLTALSGSDWRAGRIIDDAVFYNKSSMSVDQIQQFLNAKLPTCDNWGTQPYAGTSRRAYSEARGIRFPLTCLKDYHENTSTRENNLEGRSIPAGAKSAANIIWDAAQQYNINPQVLIALLQKEQALVRDDWPWPNQFRTATGYGCPDSAACDSDYYGFYNQVQNAARQFRRYASFPNEYNHIAGRNNSVRWSPNASCGSSTVYIENTATASLYNYTPYQPNQAALNNLYGTGDGCSAYGNRNFWRDFNLWFGASFGDGFVLAISDDPNDLRQWVVYGTIKQHIPDSQTKLAWGLQNVDLVTMSAATLGSINTGPPLDRLMRFRDGPIYFVDNGRRYKVPWDSLFSAWNFHGTTISSVSRGLYNLPVDSGDLTFAMKKQGTTTTYMMDGRADNGWTAIRPYQNETVRQAWEGSHSAVTVLSDDYWDLVDDAVGSAIAGTKISYNSGEYQVMNTWRFPQSATLGALYPGTATAVSATTFNRLVPGSNISPLIRSVSDQTIYLVDNGVKHALASDDLLNSWKPPSFGVQMMNDQFVSLVPSGAALSSYMAEAASQLYIMDVAKMPVPANLDVAFRANNSGVYAASPQLLSLFPTTPNQATSFMRSRSSPNVYLLDNSGQRRHLDSAAKNEAWGSAGAGVHVFKDAIVDSFGTAATLGVYMSDGSNEFVMNGGKKLTISSSVKADWGLSSPASLSDGTLSRFTTQGALENKMHIPGDGYFLIRQGAAYGSWDKFVAQGWGIQDAPVGNSEFLKLLPVRMLSRFVGSSTPGDSRMFVVDNGQWYNLTAAQQANFGVGGRVIMSLPPSLAPNSITDWTSLVIKNSAGSYYVIDGGSKRYVDHAVIRNQWTAGGSTPVPTVSDGFLGMFSTGGLIERTVKGSGPTIYFVENNTKRPINSFETYQQSYAPLAQVSDELLNLLPTGSPIN